MISTTFSVLCRAAEIRGITFGNPGRGGNSVGDVSILRELDGRSTVLGFLADAVEYDAN